MTLVRLGDLHGQVVRLAGELGCRVISDPEESSARCVWHRGRATVYTPLVQGLTTYMVALHELGHVALGKPSESDQGVMMCEALAWAWALEHALVESREEVRQEISDSLRTYAMTAAGPCPKRPDHRWDVSARRAWQVWCGELEAGAPSSVPAEHQERYRRLWWQLHRDPAGLCRLA